MIVNIPLQIDEKFIEQQMSVDFEGTFLYYLMQEIVRTITDRYYQYRNYSVKEKYKDSLKKMIDNFFENHIKGIIEEHKEEVIDKAAKILADRIGRTKKAKEVLNETDF